MDGINNQHLEDIISKLEHDKKEAKLEELETQRLLQNVQYVRELEEEVDNIKKRTEYNRTETKRIWELLLEKCMLRT